MTRPEHRPATLAEVARHLIDARRIVVVPGYGLAVAQAQHELRQLVDLLRSRGARIDYAIHPVAGRMPGHLNVLLDEARVPHDQLRSRDDIDDDFAQADVALVVGADDVINPGADSDPTSPLFGMPILHVGRAARVVVLRRGQGRGFVGIENPLFDTDPVTILMGDARESLTQLSRMISKPIGNSTSPAASA